MSGSDRRDPAVEGIFHPPASARSIPARLSGGAGAIVVTLDDGAVHRADAGSFAVSDRIAGVARRIEFADGAAFVTRDDAGLEGVVGPIATDGALSLIARLERPGARLFVIGSLAVVALVAGLRWGVPAAAGILAALTPHAVNVQIGAGTLETIDRLVTEPSKLAPQEKARIEADFRRLAEAGGLTDVVSLEFRDGGAIGANAFAVPGGIIVVTDQLVGLARHPDEISGVLAHELAHAEYRHPETAIWQAAGFGLALTVMFGDAGTLAEEAATAGTILIQQAYSRENESEADLRALELMEGAGMAPGYFIVALDRLHAECGAACAKSTWLSSHPGGEERKETLCAAIADPGPAAALCSGRPTGH